MRIEGRGTRTVAPWPAVQKDLAGAGVHDFGGEAVALSFVVGRAKGLGQVNRPGAPVGVGIPTRIRGRQEVKAEPERSDGSL